MTTETQQAIDPKVVDRIRKMLNLSRDGGATEAEAAAALEAARKTMEKYNLTLAEVEAAGTPGEAKRTRSASQGRAQYEFQRKLMETCAQVNYCAVLVQHSYRKGRQIPAGFALIGREVNVIATRELFDYLNATVERLAFDYVGRDNRQRLSRTAVNFKIGCAERLRERLQSRHEAALETQAREARERNAAARHPAAAPGTALAVVMKDFAQAEEDLNADFMKGCAPGTTALRRRVAETEQRIYQTICQALRTRETEERDVLLSVGLSAAALLAAAHSVSAARIHYLVEYAVDRQLEKQKAEEPETPAQKAKREAQDARDNARFWARVAREEAKRLAVELSSAYRAGSRAGDTVGLDKQVTDGPAHPRIGGAS
jgi:hypothetical protein